MLSPETIQAVQQTALIEEVVGDFVTLKRKGKNLWACCPFHHERTASFSVSADKGFYKCFGCDASGDSISFIKAIQESSFVEAVKYLAQKYNIPIQETEHEYQDIAIQNEKESLYILMQLASNYYVEMLRQNAEGQRIGYTYLQERNIPDTFIQQFQLGYSIDNWHGFQTYAHQKGYTDELLEKAGLLVHNQDKIYDRFRGRIIFPIHNISGKVIAFAARILVSASNQPKYINSPETIIYHKSDVLYGLYQAKQKIKQTDNCFLVEGYTDVIALHKAGIENVVASSGTSLTESQIQLISRFTNHVAVLFDGDAAGIRAALRNIDKIIEKGLHVKAILLPTGEDPDSYANKLGNLAFQNYLQTQQQDFITFKIELLMQGIGEDPIKKTEVVKDILQSISLIPDAVERSLVLQQSSRLLNLEEKILVNEQNKILLQRQKENQRPTKLIHNLANQLQLTVKRGDITPIDWATIIEAHEQESIRLLLNYGNILLEDGNPLSIYLLQELADVSFQHPVYKQILTLYEQNALPNQGLSIHFFIQHPDENIQKTAIDLTATSYEISENWQEKYQIEVPKEEDNLYQNVYKNVLRLKLRLIHQLIEGNNKLLKENPDVQEEDRLLQICTTLKQTEKAIAQQLGMVILS